MPASRKNSRRQPVEEEEEEEEEEVVDVGGEDEGEMEVSEEEEQEGGPKMMETEDVPVKHVALLAFKGMNSEKQEACIRDLVRLALACEHARIPLRRDQINKKALDNDRQASRAFSAIFRKAQKLLRRTFGYEMVELRQRGVENAELAEQRRALNKKIADQKTEAEEKEKEETAKASKAGAKRNRAGVQKEEAPKQQTQKIANEQTAPARMWMVRSVLPTELRFNMAEGTDRLASAAADSDGAEALKGIRNGDSTGIMLDWRRADGQSGSIGLLFVVLGIILVNGRECKDAKLRSMLSKLGLSSDTILPRALRPDDTTTTQGQQSSTALRKTDHSAHMVQDLLELWIKQQYLETVYTGPAALPTANARKKRVGRQSLRGAEGAENQFDWIWGGRAEAEIGEESVATFLTEILAHEASNSDDEDEEDGEQSVSVGRRGGKAAAAAAEKAQAAQHKKFEKAREALLHNIEKAIGSQFIH